MKERRVAGRVGDLAIYSDEERRRELRRRARLESDSLDNESPQTEERERVRRLLYAEGDWLDALKHGSQTPCKVTRVERETAIADRAVATSPQAALAYAQWILAKDRGGPLISGDAPNPSAIGDEVSHARSRQTDEPLGSLASMFAHQGASSRDELAARRRAGPVHAAPATRMSQVATPERPQARLAARELPGHHAGLSAEQSEAQLDEVLALLRGAGSGEPLPEAVAARMEAELGRSFAHVRIHLDSVAAEACAQLGAQAFTLGDHIYFGAGQFVPDSDAGAGLLRHELTHVVQHARGELASHGRAELVSSTSAIEAEARAAEAPKARPIRAMPAWAGGARKREGHGPDARAAEIADAHAASAAAMQQGAGPAAAEPPSAGQLALAPASPPATQGPAGALPTVVNLTGTFAPPAKVAAHIAKAGDAGAGVKVALPGLTKPAIITVKRVDGRYVTVEDKPQLVPLSHPLFVLAGPLAPMLRIQIGESGDNAVTGYVTTGAGDLAAMQNALQGNMAMLGLRGFAVPQLALTNRFAGGKLSFGTSGDVAFTLGGWVHGTVSLAMEDKKVSFAARAAIHARGIKDAQIVFTRDAKGKITGDAALSAELGPHFKGNINATYANGALAVRGKLGYQSEKLKGQLNVLFADEAEAEAMARGELPADALKPADSGEATPKGGGKRGLAGSGTLDFTFSDWLTGSAKTVFGPTGNVTVVGKIAPPKSVQLMAPKSRKLTLLPKVRLEACYGIPRLLDVHVGIAVGLDAYGVLGPVVMTDLELDGIYSTDPKVRNRFSLTGTVRAQAEAGLQLSLDGYVGLSALLHSINFGASVWGRAALQAYAEARATLGYRELADPAAGKKGEHYLQGHLEMAARPVLSFGGGLFIEATGPFVNKRWDWPLGSLQYPLPGQLGIGADIDYVIGSGKVPDVKFSRPEFDASKFTEQLMDGKLPKGGGGNRRADGKFESKTPTKTTQGKQTLSKKQTEKAAITAGDSKTKRTTGNQTEEDKKKKPKTPQEQAKTATSKNKTKDAAAKEGGKRKDAPAKAGSKEKSAAGKNEGKKKEPKDKKAAGRKDPKLKALKGRTPPTIHAKGQLAKDIAKATHGQVLFDNGVDAKTATKKILHDHKDARFDEATGTLTLPPVKPPDPSAPLVKVARDIARQTGVSRIRVQKANGVVTLRGEINPGDELLNTGDSQNASSNSFGARKGTGSVEFEGSFTKPPWTWRGYPRGEVDQHPANSYLNYKKYSNLLKIKPTNGARYTFIGGNSPGGPHADSWRRALLRKHKEIQDRQQNSPIKVAPDVLESTDNSEGVPGLNELPRQSSEIKNDTTIKKINPKSEAVKKRTPKTRLEDLSDTEREALLREYKQKNKYAHLTWESLIVSDKSQWQAHHIHEHSWGGSNERSNFQYLAKEGQHQLLTNWWNNRRDEIRNALKGEDGAPSQSEGSSSEK